MQPSRQKILIFALLSLGPALFPSLGFCQRWRNRHEDRHEDAPPFSEPTWLTGCWKDSDTGLEEFWTPSEGRTLLGIIRVVKDGETSSYEFAALRERERRATLTVTTEGRESRLQLADSAPDKIVFEGNGGEGFQRLSYKRDGDTLSVHVEQEGRNASSQEFRLRQVSCSTAMAGASSGSPDVPPDSSDVPPQPPDVPPGPPPSPD